MFQRPVSTVAQTLALEPCMFFMFVVAIVGNSETRSVHLVAICNYTYVTETLSLY